MLNLTKISAILLTASLATATTTQAEEVSLEQLVTHMLSQSVASVQQELSNDIHGAVLTAANEFSIFEEDVYATKTSITDLDSSVENTAKQQAD
jgi:hypothetical protein